MYMRENVLLVKMSYMVTQKLLHLGIFQKFTKIEPKFLVEKLQKYIRILLIYEDVIATGHWSLSSAWKCKVCQYSKLGIIALNYNCLDFGYIFITFDFNKLFPH